MKTVFMIAPYFVPRRRVGSLRPYKFVAHLQDFGWKPVICTIQDAKSHKTSEEERILEKIKILNINPPFDRTGNTTLSGKENIKNRVFSIGEMLTGWFDRQMPMDTWFLLFRSSYGKILTDAKNAEPDLIWSTGDPWSGHWVGYKLAKDLSIPWIADFRDPWTLSGLNLRERSWFSSWADQKMEKKFINSANKLIFTSKSTENLYRDYYGLKQEITQTIYNSYLLIDKQLSSSREWETELNENYFNILFFGSFRRLSPVMPVAKAVVQMERETRDKLRIHSFGKFEPADKEALKEMGILEIFVTHNKVTPEQAPAVFKKADLLLVSTSHLRKTIIPAKLWEYLTSDRPILSITPNPEIGEILNKSGAGVHFSNDQIQNIAEWLTEAVIKKRSGKPLSRSNYSQTIIEQYSSRNTTKQLAQIMNELTSYE